MEISENLPVYPMGVAAKLLEVHPRTLRIYEAEGLIKPHRQGGKRIFSKSDLIKIKCIRELIHDENLSIPGIKKLIEFTPCWKLKNCPKEVHSKCSEISGRKRKCWEFTQNACEKSCKNCDEYNKEL